MKKALIRLLAAVCSVAAMTLTATPVAAQVNGGGPYGDIDGYYTWEINGKGWTVYSQDGYSWVYDSNGHRTYLDAYGNRLDGVSQAAAKTIVQYKLTYFNTINGTVVYVNPDGMYYTVNSNGIVNWYDYNGTPTPAPAPAPAPSPAPSSANYTFFYSYTTPSGYHIYTDGYGRTWWFAQGGVPKQWTGGFPDGSYWKDGIPNYTFYYYYVTPDGLNVYRDDYGNTYWFGNDGMPHMITKGSGQTNPTPVTPSQPTDNVDYSRSNTMDAAGFRSVVYVGQYWTAPKTVSWAPDGMKLIGWDYAENTGYARWKPGERIKNTGSDLYLYPVYGR
jgi:hypothetical protein